MKNIDTFGFCAAGTRNILNSMTITDTNNLKPYEIGFDEFGMPVMCVTLKDGKLGYITPFRDYKFQVSATPDGQWDLGSSDVVTGMVLYTELGELGAVAIEAMAHVAMLKAGATGMLTHYDEYSAFVCLCIEYLRNNAERIKQRYKIA